MKKKFRLITNRQLPTRSDFEQTIRLLRRWGIARKTTDEEYVGDSANSYALRYAIRPAIIDVLGETAIARLLRWEKVPTLTSVSDSEEIDETSNVEANES